MTGGTPEQSSCNARRRLRRSGWRTPAHRKREPTRARKSELLRSFQRSSHNDRSRTSTACPAGACQSSRSFQDLELVGNFPGQADPEGMRTNDLVTAKLEKYALKPGSSTTLGGHSQSAISVFVLANNSLYSELDCIAQKCSQSPCGSFFFPTPTRPDHLFHMLPTFPQFLFACIDRDCFRGETGWP